MLRRRTRWVVAAAAVVSAVSVAVGGDTTDVAFVGQPFGVARVTLALDRTESSAPVDTNGYLIRERADRVFYPAFAERRVLGMLRQVLGVSTPSPRTSVTCFFLFTGNEPLDLSLFTPARHGRVLQPTESEADRAQLLQAWWRQYAAVAQLRAYSSDYPPILEQYLTSTLSRRLGLSADASNPRFRRPWSLEQESLLLMFNCEAMRLRYLEQTLQAAPAPTPAARVPLPPELAWPAPQVDAVPADVPVEPIARHVPAECFYVRFGSFPNYLWVDRRLKQYGGDLQRMVTLRGHTLNLTARVERQLGLSQTVLTELLGERLISDMVLLGRDAYVREGAALGVLFEARNANELLKAELMKQRQQAVIRSQNRGGTLREISLRGQNVSVAATPDNQLRSFYVSDGPYHLVTSSLAITERFLEAGRGRGALADLPSFRRARMLFPPTDDATVFAFASSEFLRGLVAPQYQTELRRRVRAITDLEIVQLARLTARHEGHPAETLEQLQAGGYLPPALDDRADGSHVVCHAEQLYDSLRGARGSFLPIPDVTIDDVTTEEAETWQRVAELQRQRWQQTESAVLQLQRPSTGDQAPGQERVVLQAQLWPFDAQQYGPLVARLGPPTTTRIRPPADDAISLQVAVRRDRASRGEGPLIVCVGMLDREVPMQFAAQPVLRGFQILRTAPVYAGVWPALEVSKLISAQRAPLPQEGGSSRLPFGLWQRTTPEGLGITLLAGAPSTLDDVAPHLAVEQTDQPAQVRLRVADLSQARVRGWFAALAHQRGYQASVGNTRLLHTIAQQLGTPPEQALSLAESLLDVQLICALGGKYQTWASPAGATYWMSTAWPDAAAADASPADAFTMPLMTWLRGADARLTQQDQRLILDAQFQIEAIADRKAGGLLDLLPTRRPPRAP